MLKKLIALFLCTAALTVMLPIRTLAATTTAAANTAYPITETDKNGDGYDDSNVYLSDIMLAIASEGGDSAIDALTSRGFTVFPDLEMYHTAHSKLYMYFGYKTTKDPNKAIKDVKWMNYSKNAYANGETALTISYGAQGAYVATKVNYLKTEDMNRSGQIGLVTKDSNGASLPYYLEEEFGSYEGAATMKLVMDIMLVGLIYDPIIHALMDAEVYSCMYYATNNSFGEPILADSLLFTNSQYEDGYENVSGFVNDEPEDLRYGISRSGIDNNDYAKLYMHFKRAHKVDYTEPVFGDDEYLYEFSTVAENEIRVYYRYYEKEGWHDAGKMYSGLDDMHLIYRTTKDPDKAIRDMRVTDNGYGIRNVAGTTYFKAVSKGNALYITKAKSAGEPILASTLKVHLGEKPELPDGQIYACEIFSRDVTGIYGSYDYSYISYGGNYKNAPRGKYIMSVMVGYGGSKTAALADLANQGAETYIDHDILSGGNYEYIGYNTTDDETLALTSLTISSVDTTMYTYYFPGRKLSDHVYFPDVAPSGRIENDGSVYTLVSHGTNIASPVHEKEGKTYERHADGWDNLTYYVWGFRYKDKYDYNFDRDFLYQTTDYMAGDPIMSISLSETPIANDGSACVFAADGTAKRYNGYYIMTQTSEYVDENQNYVSAIYTAPGSDKSRALEQLAKYGCGYYVDYNMNEGVGGDCIYIGYKKTTSKKKAIKDVVITLGNYYEGFTYNGCKYSRASGVELNYSLGGQTVAICSTTNAAAGEPIVSLCAEDTTICRLPAHSIIRYAAFNGTAGEEADMNAGIDTGSYIYLFAQRANQIAGKYISDISIVEGNNVLDALNKFKDKDIDGYIRYDLNKNAGGQFVYLGYKTTDNPGEALTGIVGYHYQSHGVTETFNGHSYTLCDEVDLNMRAGGDFIFLYQSKEPSLGAPITSLSLSGSILENDGSYTMLHSEGDWVSELNCRAGGDDIYLHFTREAPEFLPYIEHVALISDGSWGGTLSLLAVEGCNYYVDYDLNSDAGGYFIGMGYTRTDNPDKALRGLETIHGREHAWQYTRQDGAEFSIIEELDLNRDAGGDFIFMFKSYSPQAGEPI